MKFYINEICGHHYYFSEKSMNFLKSKIWDKRMFNQFTQCNIENLPENERWIFAAESHFNAEVVAALYFTGHPDKTLDDFDEVYTEYLMNKYIER